jgi:predicted metalloprotease with PDZ domain
MRRWRRYVVVGLLPGTLAALARRPPEPQQTEPARYHVAISPAEDVFRVRAEFAVPAGRDTFLVSLPAWTTGSYTIENYARYVHGFSAQSQEGRALFWDKLDKDTWRIATAGARRVVIEFRTNPDTLDLSGSWIEREFAAFNGTNLLPYPEGTDQSFPGELVIEVPNGWRVVTGLDPLAPPAGSAASSAHAFRASSYHDLVDAPVFAGRRIWLDSVLVDGRPIRFAMAPDSAMTPAVWDSVSDAIRRLAAVQNRIFGGPPYEHYTVLFYAPFVDLPWGGGLEHQNSQFDAMSVNFFAPNRTTGRLGDFTRSLLSHEFFHLWNVKRIRPAELWPYDYSREQYTPLLWWSEGVTDYYGDLSLLRSGLWSPERFVLTVNGNVQQVEQSGEIVAVEDASINTWIRPTFVDESQYYYPKGSLLGLMLDIQIRRATGNRHSLDDAMRALFTDFYRRGRGFSTQELLELIRPWFPAVDDFYARYINGREPLPYERVLPMGGFAVSRRDLKTPFVGVSTPESREGGVLVESVAPGSLAAEAGLLPGDVLLRIGEVATTSASQWGALYRARYQNAEGEPIRLSWRRGGQEMSGRATVRVRTARVVSVTRDPNPSPEAAAVFAGIAGR